MLAIGAGAAMLYRVPVEQNFANHMLSEGQVAKEKAGHPPTYVKAEKNQVANISSYPWLPLQATALLLILYFHLLFNIFT